MKRSKIRLSLSRETIGVLSSRHMGRVAGGLPAITDGNNGCRSEATGCPTVNDWSCLWASCPIATGAA